MSDTKKCDICNCTIDKTEKYFSVHGIEMTDNFPHYFYDKDICANCYLDFDPSSYGNLIRK
jgi:hypothetical protein